MKNQNAGMLHSPAGESEVDLDLADIFRVILRRRNLIYKCLAAVMLLAVLYLLIAKRTYRADAVMQLANENISSGISSLASADADTSTLQLSTTLQTYVGVLTSENLALQVIRELHLEQSPEYHSKLRKDEENLPLEQTRYHREAILRRFKGNLTVTAGSGSRILSVSFKSTSPDTARRVLDRLLQDFISYNADLRFSASERSESWLRGQLVDLKAQVERTEKAAVEAQRDTGIYGNDGSHNLVLSRLETLQAELISAEQNRIVKGAILHVVERGDPEAVSNLSSAAGQSMAPGSVNSLALVQTLRQQEAVLSSQYAQLSVDFGPGYPRLAEVEKQLTDVRASISRETLRLTQRAVNDFKAAAEQESSLAGEVNKQKVLANQSNDSAIRYLVASREATSTRDLYEHLLEKAKELGAVAGLTASDIEIIDTAHVGTAASPNTLLTLVEAAGLGLFLGICAALLRDSLDGSLYKPELLSTLTGLRLLGVIPSVSPRDLAKNSYAAPSANLHEPLTLWNAAHTYPQSRFTESFRAIRTAALLSPSLRPTKVIMIVSAAGHEGKGVFTTNFATVLSQEGRRILIVDADLRRGTLSHSLNHASDTGLADLLAGAIAAEHYPSLLKRFGTADFLPAGSTQPFPTVLLDSPACSAMLELWRAQYDFVLLSTAPVVSFTDTVTLAPRADGVILLGRAGVTSKVAFLRAYQLLVSVGAPLLGSVYNAMDTRSPEYAFYAGTDKEIV